VDDLNLSMFRANDIRTPVARLPDELALRLARAEAVYFTRVLGAPGVIVAHDARSSGPHMLEIAVDAYRDAGLDVLLLPGVTGVCPLYYAAMRYPHMAAVMFGASHNPAGDTGRKILGPAVRPIARGLGPEEGLTCIRRLYVEGEVERAEVRGSLHAFDAVPGYVAYSLHEAQMDPGGLRGIRILQDYLYGAGGREMMLGFRASDAMLEPMHFAADGEFRLGDPNPVRQEAIAPALQRLAEERFDAAMFYDGDADRLDFYLGDGTYLAASFVYAAVLPLILRRRRPEAPRVLVDVKTNPLAALEMARCGARVGLIRNGHSHIKHTMYTNRDTIGTVEESAHYYEDFHLEGRRYCTENTLYFSLLAARLLRENPDRLRAMADIQSHACRAREWGHKFRNDAQRQSTLDAVTDYFAARGASVLERLPDGSDLEGTMMRAGLPFEITENVAIPDSWLQVSQRPSQSEDGLARWELVGSAPDLVHEAKTAILRIVAEHGGGPEYQG
jgi:phosphomannomutase